MTNLRQNPKNALALVVLAATFLNACSYRHEKSQPQEPGIADAQGLSYAAVKAKVLIPHCTECHGSKGGVNLESYGSVVAALKRIEVRTLIEKNMPPGAPMPQPAQDLLASWIKAGAPETAQAQAPSHQPLPEPPSSFASIRKNILGPQCVACHSPGGKGARVPLSTERDLLDAKRPLVVPADAERSSLWIAINRKDRKRMPPAPAPELTAEEKLAIQQWIYSFPLPSDPPPPAGEKIGFEMVFKEVLRPSCTRCHGDDDGSGNVIEEGAVNLKTFEQVKAQLEDVKRSALVEGSMPENGSLTLRQRTLLASWILAGAPEGTPAPQAPTSSPAPGVQ